MDTWEHSRRILRTLLITLVVGTLCWLVYSLQTIVLLLVFAVFFAYLIAPAVELLHRWMPRALALALTYVAIGTVAAVSLSTILPRLGAQLEELAARAPEFYAFGRGKFAGVHARMPAQFRQFLDDALASDSDKALEWLQSALVTLVTGLRFAPWLVLVPLIAFFLLRDANTFRRSALQMLPEGRVRWRGQDFFEECNRTLAGFVRAQLIDCLFMATMLSATFAILGVPYAIVLGVLGGVLEFLPLVGPAILVVVACVAAATQSTTLVYSTLAAWAALRATNDYVVYPFLMGNTVGMHPLAIILSILCGGTLLGVTGMFLAIPIAAVASVGYRHAARSLSEQGWLAELLRPMNVEPRTHALTEHGAPELPRLDGVKVLVVDNESDARDLLTHVLAQNGATVTACGTAAEGLEAVRREHPHVLLSDIGMPTEDGFDFIRKVRALDPAHGGRTPAAALTGYATSEDRTRALLAGFQEHIAKPCDPSQLARVVINLARTKGPPTDARRS